MEEPRTRPRAEGDVMDLFPDPISPPSTLAGLRHRYGEACTDLEAASKWEDATGDPVPEELRTAKTKAFAALNAEESKRFSA